MEIHFSRFEHFFNQAAENLQLPQTATETVSIQSGTQPLQLHIWSSLDAIAHT